MKTFLTLSFIFSFLLSSQACEIPVFRYALERWAADKYQLLISRPASGFTAEEKEILNKLYSRLPDKEGNLNLSISIQESDAPVTSFELRYPSQVKAKAPVWNGLFNEENTSLLLNSPARIKLQELLLQGQSVIWIAIDPNEKILNDLEKYSALFSDKYKLSEEIIQMDEKDKIDSITTKKELDNVIRSTIPLKISFSILKINRNDPQEELFLNMLLAQWPGLRYTDKALVIPVFGRGRFLEAAPAEFLNEQSYKKLTDYLCSGCSCTVKSENPGIDLLMDVPWSQYISESVLKIKAIPSLSGISADLKEGKNETPVPEAKEKSSGIYQYLLILIGSGLLILYLFKKK